MGLCNIVLGLDLWFMFTWMGIRYDFVGFREVLCLRVCFGFDDCLLGVILRGGFGFCGEVFWFRCVPAGFLV